MNIADNNWIFVNYPRFKVFNVVVVSVIKAF